jgi:hypothetical protein
MSISPIHFLFLGLFLEESQSPRKGEGGLFKSGRLTMLGIQSATVCIVLVWALVVSFTLLKVGSVCTPRLCHIAQGRLSVYSSSLSHCSLYAQYVLLISVTLLKVGSVCTTSKGVTIYITPHSPSHCSRYAR